MNNTNNNSNNHASGAVTIDDLAVIIKTEFDDIREKMANMATKDKFNDLRAEINQGFASVHAELASIKGELVEIKQKLNQAIRTEQDDTRVIGGDYFKLLKRVKIMEEKIQQLELTRA